VEKGEWGRGKKKEGRIADGDLKSPQLMRIGDRGFGGAPKPAASSWRFKTRFNYVQTICRRRRFELEPNIWRFEK